MSYFVLCETEEREWNGETQRGVRQAVANVTEDPILFANEICSSERGLSREEFRGDKPREEGRVIEATDRFPERTVAFRSAGVTGRDI